MAAKRAGGSSRVVGMVAAFVAGSIARKVITLGWRRVTGKEPPTDPQDPDVALKEALSWSVVMGVGMEAARLLATRAATTRMRSASASAHAADRDQVAK
ncbi:MAG TPA: DUF4235 domain-containing protein [Streptosporangiaceae bacterium]|nr:DUF4235 domain-containing protein [Streptosporangiaceae bacterium]